MTPPSVNSNEKTKTYSDLLEMGINRLVEKNKPNIPNTILEHSKLFQDTSYSFFELQHDQYKQLHSLFSDPAYADLFYDREDFLNDKRFNQLSKKIFQDAIAKVAEDGKITYEEFVGSIVEPVKEKSSFSDDVSHELVRYRGKYKAVHLETGNGLGLTYALWRSIVAADRAGLPDDFEEAYQSYTINLASIETYLGISISREYYMVNGYFLKLED